MGYCIFLKKLYYHYFSIISPYCYCIGIIYNDYSLFLTLGIFDNDYSLSLTITILQVYLGVSCPLLYYYHYLYRNISPLSLHYCWFIPLQSCWWLGRRVNVRFLWWKSAAFPRIFLHLRHVLWRGGMGWGGLITSLGSNVHVNLYTGSYASDVFFKYIYIYMCVFI